MKTTSITQTITCLLLLATAAVAQVPNVPDEKPKEEEPIDYVIMVPPWVKTINHDQARAKILGWAKLHPEWFPALKPFPFIAGKECYIEQARANAFTAKLTPTQAASLRLSQHQRIAPKGRSKGKPSQKRLETPFFFVSPSRKWKPLPLQDEPVSQRAPDTSKRQAKGRQSPEPDEADLSTARLGTTANANQTLRATWAADAVVVTDPNTSKMSITQHSSATTPVLYVVDTGVQPIVPNGTNQEWHQEFSAAAGSSPKLRFRQGRVANSIPASWPPSGMTGPWSTTTDNPLAFTPVVGGNPIALCPAQGAPYNIDPQRDKAKHGTKIATTAIGTYTGLLGKLQVGGNPVPVDIQSIRIYDNATIPETDSVTTYEGIMHAVAAHIDRRAKLNYNPPSVLLFASRSDGTGFDDSVEVALWWAWHEGIICVASSGNEDVVFDANKRAPYAAWYPLPNFVQQTSPARFDWTTAVSVTGTGWPDWEDKPEVDIPNDNPYPEAPYLVMVGGNDHKFNTTTLTYSDGENWRPTVGGSSGYPGSSKGPDIDILAPSISVPCASLTKTNYPSTNDYIAKTTGTSLSAGYVAGVAVAYLITHQAPAAADPAINTPAAFREWLIPAATPGNSHPCKTSASATGWGNSTRQSPYVSGQPLGSYYSGCVPKLKIVTGIQW